MKLKIKWRLNRELVTYFLIWILAGLLVLLLTPKTISISRVEAQAIPPVPSILEKIAVCESGGIHQLNEKIVVGKDGHDLGKFQIRDTVWLEKAKELNFDIRTEKGNTQMTLWIYYNQGLSAWNSSKSCWSKL